MVGLIVGVIDLAVQQFQHQGHLGLFGHGCNAAQPFGRYFQAGGVIKPFAVAAKTDDVRDP